MRNRVKQNSGFTLIEMLIAMAMSAIVLTGIYSVYTTMMNTTVNETDLVDMQQELRIAMDYMSRDIKMAGALVSDDYNGIADSSDTSTLTLQTATNLYDFAVISEDTEVAAGSGSTLSIASSSMLGHFSAGDSVLIVRPTTQSLVGDACDDGSDDCPDDVSYTISSVADRDEVEAGTADCQITLYALGNSDELSIKAGDLLIPFSPGDPYPATISWGLNDTTLERSLNGNTAATIIESVSSLSFEYLDESGTATSTAEDMTAVRITLAALTDGQLHSSERERELSTIVYLRN
jgi:prepilin-type N-terminal cleavage/methylation domain-containing protein